ncbi:hypothetical protein NQ315_009683 [Exocentrus adspersus]|uniref:Coiled-coil-helix-coiled-coil-helix domain-containing protein 7 n=1 Tax=Exocentrus adspersus TaxID=1586481 RepID=A0AAV8WHB0_9CUCU|nr:hypothetical protein NQ315_009683 [Exocentrus adspersus]
MKNQDAEKNNPCLKEQLLSYQCFNDNNFDKEACQLEIENYKTCKSFWHFVTAYRRKKGILPYVPPVEERESIKREFLPEYFK